jgi:hypothetical protein
LGHFNLARRFADEAVDTKRTLGMDRTAATAPSAIRPELGDGLPGFLFPPGIGARGGVAIIEREHVESLFVQRYTRITF